MSRPDPCGASAAADLWGTLPQWLQFVATVTALWWAVYLYRRSLRDKQSAEAKLVYAVPVNERLQILKADFPYDIKTDRINEEQFPALARDEDHPHRYWRSNGQDAAFIAVDLHNDSREVMNTISVHVWVAFGELGPGSEFPKKTTRGISDVVPYLAPGKSVSLGIAMDPNGIGPEAVRLRTFVKFSDFKGRRWRRDIRGPLYWSSRHAPKSRLLRPKIWTVDDDNEYWYEAKI